MDAHDSTLLLTALNKTFGSVTSAPDDVRTTTLPSTGGGTFSTTVERLAGTTNERDWTMVRKRLLPNADDLHWDRELDTATDPSLLATLPTGLRAPTLLSWGRSPAGLTLIFEDLGPSDTPTPRALTRATRALASWNARPAEPAAWWSEDALHDEFESLADHADRLVGPSMQGSIGALRTQLSALLAMAPRLLDQAGATPNGPAHLDAYSRNLVFRGDGPIGLVDWANAGSAPIGTDPATLFTLSLDYLDIDASGIAGFEADVVAAMVAGIEASEQPESASTAQQAVTVFGAVSRLKHLAMMMNALPMVERADPAVAEIVGRPLDDIVTQWLAVGDHLLSSA